MFRIHSELDISHYSQISRRPRDVEDGEPTIHSLPVNLIPALVAVNSELEFLVWG